MLSNLLLNAIAMSPEGSTVKVETSAHGDARLVVTDSGPGVDPSRRETHLQRVGTAGGPVGPALACGTRTHSR